VRRVADDLGRLELGRELLRRLAPGLVLAFEAVRGLAVAPFVAPFLAVLALASPFFPVPAFVLLAPAGVLALAVPPAVLAVLPVRDRAVVRARPVVAPADLVAPAVAGLADEAARPVLAVPVRRGVADADRVDDDRPDAERPDADRVDAGEAGAGLAVDIVLAALVRALAAVVIALVALFMACIAVDIVLADEVARVAAAVILVAAEVTLVAADETVLAAVAGVGWELADELRVLRAVPLRAVERAAVLRRAVPPVLRAVLLVLRADVAAVLRVDLAAVPRADDLAPVARAVALVLGRPAERGEALVLTDRVLLELAGLRRAVAPVVVCTGTEFPPS
jgi:hypothetical protein